MAHLRFSCSAFLPSPSKFAVLQPSPRSFPTQTCHNRRARVVSPTRYATPCRRHAAMSLIPFIPNWVAIAGWFYGAYRFYLGFNRTSYQSTYRIPLALAWPLLCAINGSYRKNFVRSITGSDE